MAVKKETEAGKPKTNKQLDVRGLKSGMGWNDESDNSSKLLADKLSRLTMEEFKGILDSIKKINKEESKRLALYKKLGEVVKDNDWAQVKYTRLLKDEIKLAEKKIAQEKALLSSAELLNAARKDGVKILKQSLKTGEEIFNVAHKMQLESNLTWKTYSKLYNEAFVSTRKANKEIGQSIHNVKDLVNTQNKLLGTGWKNIDTGTLTNVSTAVMTMQRTLGALDARIITGLEGTYRLFGDRTDEFAWKLGNQLNEFSYTFGVEMAMLQGAVSDMIKANNFIHRSNMQAQSAASENLIKAATLAGAVGLTSTTAITNLSKTSMFGTMDEMAQVYQGGALLQGFDTAGFQNNMISGNTDTATKDLFQGIYRTMEGIDDHYLRAQYMSQIGSSFGLNQEDLLSIMTHGGDLEKYDRDIQDKVAGINNSMKDELTELNVNFKDRVENAFTNSWASQKVNKVMQDLGLYGITDPISNIAAWVKIIATNQVIGGLSKSGGMGGKIASTMFGKSAASGAGGLGTMAPGVIPAGGGSSFGLGARLGVGALGAGVGIGGNVIGRNMQTDLSKSNAAANWGGGAMNVGTGAAGGALIGTAIFPGIGTAIGAGVGAIAGGINTAIGVDKRKKAQAELAEVEDEKRRAKSSASFVRSEDPTVNAINAQTVALVNVLSGNHEENKTLVLVADMYRQTTTIPEG